MIYIVTCEFNDRKGLLKTADSLRNLGSNTSWIVVSPTLDLPSEISDLKPRHIVDNAQGVYHAMNLGIHSLNDNHSYIFFLNAGDEIAKDGFLHAINSLQGGADLYLYKVLVLGKNSLPIRTSSSNPEMLQGMLRGGRGFLQQGAFYKRSLFYSFGDFDEGFRIAGDLDFFARVIGKVEIVHGNFVVSKFYLGGMSSINRIQNTLEVRRIRLFHNRHSGKKRGILFESPIFMYCLSRALLLNLLSKFFPRTLLRIQMIFSGNSR